MILILLQLAQALTENVSAGSREVYFHQLVLSAVDPNAD